MSLFLESGRFFVVRENEEPVEISKESFFNRITILDVESSFVIEMLRSHMRNVEKTKQLGDELLRHGLTEKNLHAIIEQERETVKIQIHEIEKLQNINQRAEQERITLEGEVERLKHEVEELFQQIEEQKQVKPVASKSRNLKVNSEKVVQDVRTAFSYLMRAELNIAQCTTVFGRQKETQIQNLNTKLEKIKTQVEHKRKVYYE